MARPCGGPNPTNSRLSSSLFIIELHLILSFCGHHIYLVFLLLGTELILMLCCF